MVFKIRKRKPRETALRSIENTQPTKPSKAVIGSDAPNKNFVKGALNAASPKARSTIRAIFKRTNNKKRKNVKNSILGLMKEDPVSLRAKTSIESESLSSLPVDPGRNTIRSTSRPPLPPPSVQHIRYRHEYNRPVDEASARNSVVDDDSIYGLMMQELKQDFSDSNHAPLNFVPAQTVVRSNKTREKTEYDEDVDKTLRFLDEERVETRGDSARSHEPATTDKTTDSFVETIGPLSHASQEDRRDFEAQLDCASEDDPQAGSSDRSVGDRSARSSKSVRSINSGSSGTSARSSRSARSGGSAADQSVRESELVSLRELRGKHRHRKQKNEVSSATSSDSDDSTEYTAGKQSLRKLSRRKRVPVDSRSYYSEATGTFDDTTLGDTEFEWDNIDSFDSWLSLENELRHGVKDDWFCGACSW
ncbi:MAG: hypothetical protein SGBAC_006359 [Bacillariaceae sp.]